MSWLSRLRNALHPQSLDEEIAEEMRDHLERRAVALGANGLTPDEAQRRAAVRFGNVTRLREESREARLWATLESALQDVRYAWRTMAKSPAFAVTAVLSLALAIGANTAIYSIVDAAMLRPLPVPEPERLFTLATPDIRQPGRESQGLREAFNYPLYQQLRAAAGSSARLALFGYANRGELQGRGPGAPLEKVTRQFVAGEGFEILGVTPALGRVLSRQEDRTPGGHPVVVLSHDYWRRRFHADRGIVGRNLLLDGKSYSVAGVAREGFFGVEPGKFVDIWVPVMMYDPDAFTNAGWDWFRILGRLGQGTSREQLQARLQPALHRFQEEHVKEFADMPAAIREQFRDLTLLVEPGAIGASGFRQTFARPLWIVFGVASGLLLIACANVASLLLARATARSLEMAMRVSLGAGRRRLVRQLLTESVLLAACAGGIGWLLARLTAPMLVSLLSQEGDPVRFALAMDSRVLLFCTAVSTLAVTVFGLLPAWQASGAQPMETLRKSSGQAGRLRLGRLFVGVQVACAFCLVLTGAAFLYSLRNLFAVDTGFATQNLAVLYLGTEAREAPERAQRELMNQLQRRVAALSGVQAAATANWAIFEGSVWTSQVLLPGQASSERSEIFYRVSPGYFAALQTPLLAGRELDTRDGGDAVPIPTVVNRAFVRRYFGAGSALGQEFQHPANKNLVRHRVVGVAADAHYGDLRKGAEPIVYVPLQGQSWFALYIRSPLPVGTVARLVEREARALGSGMRVREVTTLETLVGNTVLREKLLAGIGGVFALLGLLLAAVGLFGLLNYSVARRTKEIGIRAALGARRGQIVMLVLRDLVALIGGGLVVGLAGALAVMTVLQSLLFGVRWVDPVVIGTAMVVFLAAALVAGGLPARRAAGVEPVVALRVE